MLPLSNQRKTKTNNMSVTLRKKENGKTTSLYLDIYHNGKRYKEYLKECKLVKVSTPLDRQTNQEKMRLAKQIEIKRAHELQSTDYNVVPNFKNKIDILDFFQSFIDSYTKKDKRNVEAVFKLFKQFLSEQGITNLPANLFDENIAFKFSEYLKNYCSGEGASSYFARFKKVLKQAVREKIILVSPANEITIKRDESIKKDVLSIKEIQTLVNTPLSNKEVRNAFLFSCFTGLRWVDMAELKWKHLDLVNKLLTKTQTKTGVKVKVNLSDNALSFLPEKSKKEDFVYVLPSHTGALKTLRNWTSKAGIEKHITWHCARHSFATNLIYYKNDVVTVSELLGHSSLKYTQRYTRVADEMKQNAVDSLPKMQ
jgi:integrase/recombinase XerD